MNLSELERNLVKVEPTPIQKMSDNELCRKLDIARRNIEKWKKRENEIQRERSVDTHIVNLLKIPNGKGVKDVFCSSYL